MTKLKKTVIIKLDYEKPEITKIRKAAKIIRKGGIVAFPTETVYGLGGDALNPYAVKQIYAAKKRPLDNPIIVHVSNKTEIYKLSEKVSYTAKNLMDAFWPGPLTLVLKASKIIPKESTGGLDTIALRMPSSKVALALIKESSVPIAAPSANLAGRPSPTSAEHVKEDLDGRIDMILDAGSTKIGVESTVLDLTLDPPQILRPGGVTYEELKLLLPHIELHPSVISDKKTEFTYVHSPGLKHKHYAPKAKVIVIEGNQNSIVRKINELTYNYKKINKKVGILATDENEQYYFADIVKSIGSRKTLTIIARNLFRLLREFDKENVDLIIAEGIPSKRLGLAVMNRLRKAADFNIIRVE